MSLYRIKIRDDRGKRVALPRLLTDPILTFTVRDKCTRKALWEARALLKNDRRIQRQGMILGALMGTVFALASFVPSRLGAPGPTLSWVTCGAVLLIIYAVAPEFWRAGFVRCRESLIAVFVSHDRCACCAHSLTGLPVADDGCLVCPECGAAWRKQVNDGPEAG
jgi:hypothetical protein